MTKRCTLLLMVLALLAACGSSPKKAAAPVSAFTFVDSTLYFADSTASISMRATFTPVQPSAMAEGYKFQFRSIDKRTVFLSSISLVAGGRRIFLEQGQVVLSNQNSVILQLSLEDSLFIAQYPSALIQFKHNNSSQLFSIELHQLREFSPR